MINTQFKKLCNEIDFSIPAAMEKAKINIMELKNSDSLVLGINFFSIHDANMVKDLYTKIIRKNNLPYKEITLEISVRNIAFTAKTVLDYLKVFFEDKMHIAWNLTTFNESNTEIVDDKFIIFNYQNDLEKYFIEKQSSMFEIFFYRMGFGEVVIRSQPSFKYRIFKNEQNENEKKWKLIRKEKIVAKQTNQQIVKSNQFYKKINSYIPMSIIEILEGNVTNVSVKGEIFKIEPKEIKNEMIILSVYLTDYTEAVMTQKFFRNKVEYNKFTDIKVGDCVVVCGILNFNKYLNEEIIRIDKLIKTDSFKNKLLDSSKEKTVHLNVRTTMSTMDGFKEPKDFFQIAKDFKHTSFAITDLNSVQSFPDFYNGSKHFNDIKPIYGVALSATTKNNGCFLDLIQDFELKHATYISFDLETTSLSPYFGDIIEFGATKISKGSIKERIQFFIKPKGMISDFTTELTGIKNEDVLNAISQEEGIKKIADYIDGHILVAHNANFDYSYLKQKINKYKLKLLNVTVIDSLSIARLVGDKKAKRFRLGNVAKRAGITYDSNVSHRANYDAEVLAKIWIKFLDIFDYMNYKMASDIQNVFDAKLYSKRFKKQITVLVKKQAGLKKLFKLVSLANTKNYFGSPTTFIEDIKKDEDILFGSGGINSPLIDEFFFGEENKVKELLKVFDYIELPTPRSFSHLIKRGDFTLKQIQKGLKKIYFWAKKFNVPVIASTEIRYTEPDEKLLHKIYIQAKGKGGKRHSLFKFKEENPDYPTMNFLSTREMIEEYSFLQNANYIDEIIITNPNLIAQSTERIIVIKDGLFTPKLDNSAELLSELVYKNARLKYGKKLPNYISERIEKELKPIVEYGYDVIYWISHKLVATSLKDGYLVGSRGSVGSSIIATLSGITEVNPLNPHYYCAPCGIVEFVNLPHITSGFDLEQKNCSQCNNKFSTDGQTIPFETFLGLKADKVPDIDLNFSGEYQSYIHDEVKKIFGESRVFRAGTISTVAEKTAFGFVKNFAEENKTDFSNNFVSYLANKITGVKRTTGQHPGGIIVIPEGYEVEDFCPINYPADEVNASWKTTHFDFHAIHDNVLKLDLLGHDDPTAIKMLCELTGVKVDEIPFNDSRIISLFSSPKALGIKSKDISGEKTGVMGIPEFGTPFVRRMLREAKVTSFADLISVSGLSHGTNVWSGNAQTLIKEQNLTLKQVISCRDDIMTFLLNHEVDHLKAFRIMEKVRKGKGITESEEKNLIEKNVPQWYVDSMKKILYMFPKAHATAYVMMAWRVAWFKIYYPLEYYATYFSTRADITEIDTMVLSKDKVALRLKDLKRRINIKSGDGKLTTNEVAVIPVLEITEEMQSRGFKIDNVDLYRSDVTKWIIDEKNKTLIPPFLSIAGLGEAAAVSLVEERAQKEFISIEDLSKRTLLNKTTIKKMKEMKVLKDLSEKNQILLF